MAAAGDRLFNLTDSPEQLLFSFGVVTALAVHDRTIFVGTMDGVYLSKDSAQSFVDWSEGLPVARRIVALGAVDHAAYAVTFGGEVWRRAYPEGQLNDQTRRARRGSRTAAGDGEWRDPHQ